MSNRNHRHSFNSTTTSATTLAGPAAYRPSTRRQTTKAQALGKRLDQYISRVNGSGTSTQVTVGLNYLVNAVTSWSVALNDGTLTKDITLALIQLRETIREDFNDGDPYRDSDADRYKFFYSRREIFNYVRDQLDHLNLIKTSSPWDYVSIGGIVIRGTEQPLDLDELARQVTTSIMNGLTSSGLATSTLH